MSTLFRSVMFLGLLALGGASARGDDAQKVFDDLFGAKVKAAAASVDRADDIAVAKELIKAGELVTQQPAVLALLCDHAYDLTKRDAAGLATAIDAMELLAKHVPDRAADASEKILDIRQRQFTAAKADDKTQLGEALIDAFLQHAEAKTRAKAFADAAGSYRKALSTARLIKSSRHDSIKTALDEATEREKLAVKLAKLKADAEAKPTDPAAPRELVLLHLIEFDDPTEASSFLLLAKDDTLQKRVLLAGKPLSDVKEADALDLGEWYRGLAEQTAAPMAKRKMLTRSSTYLKHYLALKKTADLTTTKAQLMVNTVASALDKLGGPVDVSMPPNPGVVVASNSDTSADAAITDLASLKPIAAFTAPNEAAGLELTKIHLDDAFTTETFNGRPAVVMQGLYLAFKLDDAIAKDVENEQDRWFLRITAFDRKTGFIGAMYDARPMVVPNTGNGVTTQTPWFRMTGSNTWTTIDLELARARFANRQAEGTDFRLIIGDQMKPTYIHKVELFRVKLPPRTQRVLKPGQSVDLLKLIAPAIDTIHGDWAFSDKVLRGKSGNFARVGVPINITGSYELQVQFTRTSGKESVNFMLPAGDRHVALILDGYLNRGMCSGLETLNGKLAPDNPTAVTGEKLTNGKLHTSDIKVKLTGGGQAEIKVNLDGQQLFEWSGTTLLFTGSAWRMPETSRLGFGAFHVGVEFKSAKLKLLDGEAVLLTSLPTMKAALLDGAAGTSDAPAADGVALSSLQEKIEFAATFGKTGRLGSISHLRVNGTDLKNALAVFPAVGKPAHISYDLGGKYRTFIGAVGVNDMAKDPFSDLTFTIQGDGKELWKSQPTRTRGKVQPFQVDVTNVKKLELFVSCSGPSGFCNSLWVEPVLYEKEMKLDAIHKAAGDKGFFGLPTN